MIKTQLETQRLILRYPTSDDAEALAKAIKDPIIAATTLNIPHPYTVEDARSWIEMVQDQERKKENIDLSVFMKESGELIGGIGLVNIREKHRHAELGYWCAVSHWNKGITTEAASRLVKYGFEELKLERIHATCFVSNPASASVQEKVGMKHEGTGRHEYIKDGESIDLHHYAIISSDWEDKEGVR